MNLEELKRSVDFLFDNSNRYGYNDAETKTVGIEIKVIGSVGGTPICGVRSIQAGFDWDSGKIIIVPERNLRLVDVDELEILRKKYEELSWKKYEIDGLKREIKKLKEENQKLKQLSQQKPEKPENE